MNQGAQRSLLAVDGQPARVTVARWRRYGHDRLYVTAPDGTRLGWHDLHSGDPHPSFPACAEPLAQAVRTWRETLPPGDAAAPHPASPSAASAPDVLPHRPPVPTGTSTEQAWEDLSHRHPGALSREQADRRREAAPLVTFLARLVNARTEERAWRLGAVGEEKVAGQLARLARRDPEWRVLHAVPVGERGADIDHVVIGPAGVFTVNAKHHPGAKIWVADDTLLVNGRRQPYLRNSRHEADRAARLLGAACGFRVPVRALIVPVRAESITVKAEPTGVDVVARYRLARWLLGQPRVLSSASIGAIVEQARRSTTWQPAAQPSSGAPTL